MQTSTSSLTAEELLHLAIEASTKDKAEAAIEYLKRAIDLKPNDGRIHYMLAAEHAQIGMFNEATEEITRAVELDPSLHTAHFQLGLLHLTSGRPEMAYDAWVPLDALSEDHFLYLFKSGLEHLARDEFEQCVEKLTRGIALNKLNEPLNNDMRRIINDVQAITKDIPPPPDGATIPAASGGHTFISAYTNTKS